MSLIPRYAGTRRIFLFEQIQGRRFRKALSAVSAPNGGYRSNAAQLSCTVHTEQHDQKDDQQGTENIYKEVNTAVLHNHIHTDPATMIRLIGTLNPTKTRGKLRLADKKCYISQDTGAVLPYPSGRSLHDADFAILLFHCEQQGKARTSRAIRIMQMPTRINRAQESDQRNKSWNTYCVTPYSKRMESFADSVLP